MISILLMMMLLLLITVNVLLLTARIKAGEVSANETHSRSISQLLNGTYLSAAHAPEASSSSFYVEDPVTIVYAVGNYIGEFYYWLQVSTGSDEQRIPLHDFRGGTLLLDNLNGCEWPSDVPASARGGTVVRQFSQPGIYSVVFEISGQLKQNENDNIRVEVTITVSTKPTLQVPNHCNVHVHELGYEQ